MATEVNTTGTRQVPVFSEIPDSYQNGVVSVGGVLHYWNGSQYLPVSSASTTTPSEPTIPSEPSTPTESTTSEWDKMYNNPAYAVTYDYVPSYPTASKYINVKNMNGIGTTSYVLSEAAGNKYVPTAGVEFLTSNPENNANISSLYENWYADIPYRKQQDVILVGLNYVSYTWVEGLNEYVTTEDYNKYYKDFGASTPRPTPSTETSSTTTTVLADAYESGDSGYNGAVSETAVATTTYTTDDLYVMSLNSRVSGNATAGKQLKRMELSYGGTVVKFAVNPSDYTQKEPNRVNITQTKGGAWIDAWGAGITEFTIKGITGVSGQKKTSTGQKVTELDYISGDTISNNSSIEVGYQRWKELRDLFRSVYNAVVDGQEVTELIKLYNYTDNEFWYCYPTQNGIELYRSKSKPHVYQYTISLWGIRRIGEPSTSTGVIGNPNKADTTSNAASGEEVDDEENTNANENVGVMGSTEDAEGNPKAETTTVNGSAKDDTNTATTPNASTKSSSTSTVSGGTAYRTTAAALDTQADVTTITNTRTKSNASLREWSGNHATSMAPIVGGYNGLLVPTTAYFTAKDVEATSTGMILHMDAIDMNNILTDPDEELDTNRLLEEVRFAPMVAPSTYLLQQMILAYSPTVMTPELIHPVGNTPMERIMQTIEVSDYYGSTLYEYIEQYKPKYYLTKTDIKYLKVVLLDSMALYYYLNQIAESTGRIITPITLTNIMVLIQNVQALIMYLDLNKTDQNDFYVQNVIWELRQLEYILHQVKTDVIEYL